VKRQGIIGTESGIGIIFLCFVLISAFPGFGYSQYYQGLPESHHVEQVFTPFSGINEAGSYTINFSFAIQELSSNKIQPDYRDILNAANHSFSVIFRAQKHQLLTNAGNPESIQFTRYSSDYQDDDENESVM